MRVICQQQDLNKGLATVVRATSRQPPLPILNNMVLTTEQGRLKLAATNLEMTICCWIDAEVEEEGTTTLPAKLLADFVNSLPSAPVNLACTEDTHQATIIGLRSRAHIQGVEPTEFPSLPTNESNDSPIILDASVLKEIIDEVTIAASSDLARSPFNGVYVEVKDEQLTFVAADSFRLAWRVIHLPGYKENPDSMLIPARTLSELARILPEEGSVQMLTIANGAQVLFHSDTLDLTSRLLIHPYPNFRALIPGNYVTRAVIDVKEFTAIVKSVLPFSPGESRIVHLTIMPDKKNGLEPGTLTLEAEIEGVGANVSSISVAVNGPEQHIMCNAKYLSEYLAVLRAPEVALELCSPTQPAILKPVNFTDYLYMVMPFGSKQ